MFIAFDTETRLIEPGNQFPRMVCLQYWIQGNPCILNRQDGIAALFQWLRAGYSLVGAETAYDVMVPVANAGEHGQELLGLFVQAYEQGRVYDILLRQQLIDLSRGVYGGHPLPDGRWRTYEYNLDALSRRHLGMTLQKGEDSWRLRYAELDGIPFDRWPADALDYALRDPYSTGLIYHAQERERHTPYFPGLDPLADQGNQARAALWLKAMAGVGLRTAEEPVRELREETEEKYAELRDSLLAEGLVRREAHKDIDAIARYARDRNLLGHLLETGPVGTRVSLTKSRLLATGDPILALVADWKYQQQGHGFRDLERAGLANATYHRNTKVAADRMVRACLENRLPIPRTDSYDPEKHTTGECVKLDRDACDAIADIDPILSDYADLSSLSKTISNDIPTLMLGSRIPIHTHYTTLRETGRTSSSAPNVQNQRRLPGIRECFRPRAGYVFLDCDFSGLELHTLAQVCKWLLGYSTLGDTLLAGRDPHLAVAASLLGVPYEEAERRYRAGDPETDTKRQIGKVANFGFPGGLGVKTLIMFAAKGYRVRLSEDQSADLKRTWYGTFLEMRDFFRMVESLETFPESGRFNVVQPWSMRLRANATYCSAANSFFQGLGADVAKLAGWFVFKACYLDTSSPLYGCRPVLFVHDQFLVECPEVRAHEAVLELKRLMDLAGVIVLPDVPVKAGYLVARQYSKKAKRIERDGRVVPWDIEEACYSFGDKALANGACTEEPETLLAYLIEKEWPRAVARRAVAKLLSEEP